MSTVKVVLARHGRTGKAAVDAARMLTDEGKEQCVSASKLLKGDFQVVSSTAVRAIETAWLLLGQNAPREIITLKELFEHPLAEGREKCNKLFGELGYAPLSRYIEREDGKILLEIGDCAKKAVRNTLGFFDKNTMIVSHAVIINAVGLRMFPRSPQVERVMLEHNFPEAGMVEIEIETHSQEVVGIRIIN